MNSHLHFPPPICPKEISAADLDVELSAYESMREQLQWKHAHNWALFHQGKLVGVYTTFPEAAEVAVQWFGSEPYLIHQIDSPPAANVLNGPWRDLIASVIAPRKLTLSPLSDGIRSTP